MAPCNVSWNCDGVAGSTVLTNNTSVKFCSNGPPTLGGNCSSGTVVIINEGLCINGQCESDCMCYSVQNTGTTPTTIFYRNCTTNAIVNVTMQPNDYIEVCSTSIPTDSTATIRGTYAGTCVNNVCVQVPQVDYYAIRVENCYDYLGDIALEDEHIQYVLCQGFKIYQMYGLYDIFFNTVHPDGTTKQPDLSRFLLKLYNVGLKPVAILGALEQSQGGLGPNIYTTLAAWETGGGSNTFNQKFWGVNKENYFWLCPPTCNAESEPFAEWVQTLNWLRTGFGVWHTWHISCLVDINPLAPWGAAVAAQIVGALPDVIEVRNEVDANTAPPPPFTIGGTPYPTNTQFTYILNLLQSAAVNLGITNQQISVYWNAGFSFAGNFLETFPTHGPALFDWQNIYDTTVAPTLPNLSMQGLTMYTYESLNDCQPLCIPGYTTTTTTAGGGATTTTTTVPPPIGLPQFNKIFVLWLYNRGYRSLIGNSGTQAYTQAPYINQTLRPLGTTFAGVYGQYTVSQPNYLAAFAGDNFGVTNNTPWAPTPPLNVQTGLNLFTSLQGAGKTFASYIQSIPSVGYQPTAPLNQNFNVGAYDGYRDPAINFSNVTQSVRKNWNSFNPATAENVCFLIPDSSHNMNNSSIQATDFWMSNDAIINSAVSYAQSTPGVLFVLYGDSIVGGDPRLPVVFIGQGVNAGTTSPWIFPNGHYSLLKTILACNGINTPIGNIASSDIIVGWY